MKFALNVEAENWTIALGKCMNENYREKLVSIVEFITDYTRRLSHPIKDLDDIRFAMAALADIRNNEIRIDTEIGPIEVRFFCLIVRLVFLNEGCFLLIFKHFSIQRRLSI